MAVKQTWRGLVSMTMLVSGIISVITGIVLYIIPAGRVANWVIWDLFGLSKDAWQATHTLSSYLILVFGIFHVINNWRSITKYFFKKDGGLNQVPQMIAAVLMSLIIVFSAIFHLPPLSWIMDFGGFLKESWVTSPEYEPPFGHAEALSLKAFALRMDMDLDAAVAELRSNGIEFADTSAKLEDIAADNNTTPMAVYMMIKQFERKIEVEKAKVWTDTEIEARFAGTGIGRKSVAQIAEQLGMPVEDAIAKLAAIGIAAVAEDLLKDIRDRSDLIEEPIDVIKMLLKN